MGSDVLEDKDRHAILVAKPVNFGSYIWKWKAMSFRVLRL